MQTLLYFNNVRWVYLIYFHGKMTKQETFLVKLPSILKGLWMFLRSSEFAAAKGKELGTWHINFNCVWCRMSTRNDFFHAILNRDLQIGDTDSIRDIRQQNNLIGDRYTGKTEPKGSPSKSKLDGILHGIQIQIVRAVALFVGIVTSFNRHKILDCWTIDKSEIKTWPNI